MKQSYHKVRPWAETYMFIREILSLAMWNRCLMVERIIRPMCGWIERGGSISKYQKSAKGCCFWELLINQNQVKVVQNIFVLFVRYNLCLEFFFSFVPWKISGCFLDTFVCMAMFCILVKLSWIMLIYQFIAWFFFLYYWIDVVSEWVYMFVFLKFWIYIGVSISGVKTIIQATFEGHKKLSKLLTWIPSYW